MADPTFKSLDEMAAATAGALAQAAAGSAFHLFQEKQFRRLARFNQLSQVEHDRIFNEICRSETDGRDDLFKHTLHWLAKYYVELRVRFEGGTITPLDRVQVALKWLLRRLRPGR